MKQGQCVLWLVPAIALVLSLTVPARGQGSCVEVCGDVNHSGYINLDDALWLAFYLMGGGSPPPCYDEAEFDGRQYVTFYDFQWFLCTFPWEKDAAGWPDWACAEVEPPLVPAPDSGHYVQVRLCDLTVPAGATSITVPLLLNNHTRIRAFSLPLKFRVGDEIPDISVDSWQAGDYRFDMTTSPMADDSGRVHLAAASLIHVPSITGLHPLARLHLEFASSPSERSLSIEWTTMPPVQDGQEIIIPMIIEGTSGAYLDDFPAKAPDLVVKFCTKRGDFDGDVVLTVSDLTQMIQCIFGDCFYQCTEFLDIDASGTWNISDITYFVAFLFQGGPEPPPC